MAPFQIDFTSFTIQNSTCVNYSLFEFFHHYQKRRVTIDCFSSDLFFFIKREDWQDQKNTHRNESISVLIIGWALTDSNRRPSACKADALNQLS